jgi:hypothetical protein
MSDKPANLPALTPSVHLPKEKDAMTTRTTRAALLTSTALTRTPAFGTSAGTRNRRLSRTKAPAPPSSANLPALTPSVRPPAASKLDVAPLFDAAIFRPTGGFDFDVDYAIGCVAVFLSQVRPTLSAQFSREWIETTIIRKLREGRLDRNREAIEEAEAGDEIYHTAVCYVASEMESRPGPEAPPGLSLVWDYGKLALKRAPHKRRPGRPKHDNWVRDAEYCTIIWHTCRELGVRPTRNQAARRADLHAKRRTPSGISILVAALARNGIHLSETSVRVNIWDGPRGRLVREELDREFGLCIT